MKGIQNKIIISQKVCITPLQRKLSEFFSEYITFSINFNVGFLGGMANIQTILYLTPRSLKHVGCYHSHSIPYAGFHVLKVIDLNLVDGVLHITPE
jgi:hypothetical protein